MCTTLFELSPRPSPLTTFLLLAARHSHHATLLIFLLACCGCTKEKTTAELLVDLKGQGEKEKIIAARLLPENEVDAEKVIPALVEALKEKDSDVRRSAAIGLGGFGAQAKQAIPALQVLQHDHDARIRESASLALSRIDPTRFSSPYLAHKGKGQ